MVKLLGSACILSGGVLAVWQALMERRRRQDTLAELMIALRRMAEEIRMLRTPLPRLLEDLAAETGNAAAFFSVVSAGAKREEHLTEVWRQAAEALPLPEKERRAVAAVGDSLHGDENMVCNGISLAIYELTKSAEEWDEQRSEEEKRTAALCLSGAALLVILLI